MGHSKLEVLRSIELFSELAPAELENLSKIAVSKEYAPGEVLFLEGQPCEGLWIIGEGAAQVVKTTPQGRQLVLATQTAPSTVAEVPVFYGGPYPASVTAIQPTVAFLILKKDFLSLCRGNPVLTLRFLKVFGRRLRHLVGLAERITFGTIRQRLAHELLSRAKLAGGLTFRLEETQEELASQMGTVREVVSRNLSRFQTEGLLRIERKNVEILNQAGLQSEAETEM